MNNRQLVRLFNLTGQKLYGNLNIIIRFILLAVIRVHQFYVEGAGEEKLSLVFSQNFIGLGYIFVIIRIGFGQLCDFQYRVLGDIGVAVILDCYLIALSVGGGEDLVPRVPHNSIYR